MSTHSAIAAAVDRAMRQVSIIRADLETIDSEPQAWSLFLPPENPARYQPILSDTTIERAAIGQ